MGTHKVYLTPEQWERICVDDEEIRAEVAAQQPEMYALLCGGDEKKQTTGDEHSPVADKNAPEAIDQISRMRTPDELRKIVANDKRVSVREAASERLAQIETT